MMTPRERLLAAIRREETDYIPCAPTFWSSPTVEGYRWESLDERFDVCINRLGVDAAFDLGVSAARHPDVKELAWVEEKSGERYPLIHKEIETPAGTLTCTVRKTEDYPHGDDIPLVSDFVVSRIVKPWIETMEDVEKYSYLCMPPPDDAIGRLRASLASRRELLDKYQIPVRSACGMGLTASLSLCGAEGAALLSVDKPDVIEALAEVEHRAAMQRVKLAVELGVDMISRNGFYETTDFWSPAQIERFILPRLQREVRLAHEGGVPVVYTVCTGLMPMIPQLQKSGVDCLIAIEPVLGNQDMKVIARELGKDKCIWAGVSGPIHIGEGSPEEVRAAVREAAATFGRRGFILSAVPSIRPHWPWENVMAMIDEWKKVR
ncbi:MAG: uroporphyrinogen decarboxylase family protein [Planctomycetota bacterium]